MTTAIILRILDVGGALLGWADVAARARGDGCLWTLAPTTAVAIETAGIPAEISAHWADVHIEQRTLCNMDPVTVGQILTLTWPGPILVVGPLPGPLPPVTVRSPVRITVPVGSLGARSS